MSSCSLGSCVFRGLEELDCPSGSSFPNHFAAKEIHIVRARVLKAMPAWDEIDPTFLGRMKVSWRIPAHQQVRN